MGRAGLTPALALWTALHAAVMGGVATAYSMWPQPETPDRVGIAIDASFPMRPLWPQVHDTVRSIVRRHPHAQIRIVTGPGQAGAWTREPSLDGVLPFAPRRIEPLLEPALWEGADKVYLITGADAPALRTPEHWETKRLK